jgi:hypothetical protein
MQARRPVCLVFVAAWRAVDRRQTSLVGRDEGRFAERADSLHMETGGAVAFERHQME